MEICRRLPGYIPIYFGIERGQCFEKMAFLVSENQSCLCVAPVCMVMYFPKAALGCLRQERRQRMFGIIPDGEVSAKAEHGERQLLGAGKRAENPSPDSYTVLSNTIA